MSGSLTVRAVDDPAEFGELAQPLLLRDEARHNLLLGIAETLVRQPSVYPEFHLWIVTEESGAIACAAMTPPFNVVVSRAGENALRALADAIAAAHPDAPGVTAAVPEADIFAASWERVTGAGAHVKVRQKIYEASEIREPSGVPGRMRRGVPSDLDLVVSWTGAFYDEALTERPGGDARIEELVGLRLKGENGGLYLWEHEEPVSLAGYAGFTPNGVRIGPVYTPPEHRRRGYAGALTAALSKHLLSEGRRFCFLYTDASNPTSNHIYSAIGYAPVCDSVEYRFER